MQYGEFVAFNVEKLPDSDQGSTSQLPAEERLRDGRLRTRRFGFRSPYGCLTCKKRHIKCDELRPSCRRCLKSNMSCIYTANSAMAFRESGKDSPTSTFPSSLYTDPFQASDLQFWSEIGARTMGRWHCPLFHQQLLPQISSMHESVRYSMLSLAVCVRQWHTTSSDSRDSLAQRGSTYYSKACQALLQPENNTRASIEAALVASLVLFTVDSFTNHLDRRNLHVEASLSLLRMLKQGFTWNAVSGWRSETGKAGQQHVIMTAESWLNDISWPLSGNHLNLNFSQLTSSPIDRTKLYSPLWLRLDHRQVSEAVSSSKSDAAYTLDPLNPAWTLVNVMATSFHECCTYLTTWHCWLLTWLIRRDTSMVQLQEYRKLARSWHQWLFDVIQPARVELVVLQNRALILDAMFEVCLLDAVSRYDSSSTVEAILVRILDLLVINISLPDQHEAPKSLDRSRSQTVSLDENIRGLAKVPEFVLRRTSLEETKQRARDILALKISPPT